MVTKSESLTQLVEGVHLTKLIGNPLKVGRGLMCKFHLYVNNQKFHTPLLCTYSQHNPRVRFLKSKRDLEASKMKIFI